MLQTSTRTILAAMIGAGLLSPAASTQAQDDGGGLLPASVSGSIGVEFTNEYYFRGIAQENQGFIAQPSIELGVNLISDGAGSLQSLDLTVGSWNSIHDGPSGSGGPANDAWYETDFYIGLSAGFADKWTGGVTYTLYNSPNNLFTTTQEFAFSLGYDDSDMWALNPSVTIAVETTGGADAGGDLGVYLELGIEKSWEDILSSESLPVTFSIPVTLGFSIDDYYEDGMGDDDFFGYADIGFVFSTQLSALLPIDLGPWDISAGFHVLILGDSAQTIAETSFAVDGNADVEFIGVLGLSMSF